MKKFRILVPSKKLLRRDVQEVISDLTEAAGGCTRYYADGLWINAGVRYAEAVTALDFAFDQHAMLSLTRRAIGVLLRAGEEAVYYEVDNVPHVARLDFQGTIKTNTEYVGRAVIHGEQRQLHEDKMHGVYVVKHNSGYIIRTPKGACEISNPDDAHSVAEFLRGIFK